MSNYLAVGVQFFYYFTMIATKPSLMASKIVIEPAVKDCQRAGIFFFVGALLFGETGDLSQISEALTGLGVVWFITFFGAIIVNIFVGNYRSPEKSDMVKSDGLRLKALIFSLAYFVFSYLLS